MTTPNDRTETVVTEQPAAPTHTHTTVIERRSGGGSGLMMALALLVLVVGGLIAWQFLQQGEVRTDAVAGAANQVGDAAQQVGDAAQDAAQKIGE
ncbi:hypothetical protein [Blastomonas sp.]|uniref:hypothetical protein n=1 Tax=Blastomonas sp. TaxID=1909299 RepID=UPI002606C741|nr:hypothetical protein [Blastomonas sp.]MDM7955334.1 hypothetical protein [Blastomonas sp.]